MDKKIAAADEGTGPFRNWAAYRQYPPREMLARAADFRADMERRRTLRDFRRYVESRPSLALQGD